MRYVEARVCAIDGEFATVEVKVLDGGCGRCHDEGGCGGQNITRALCDKTKKITVANTLGAGLGDTVFLGMEEQVLRAFATRAYVLPFLGLIFGAAFGQQLFASVDSLGGIFGGMVGFVSALMWAKYHVREAEGPRMVARNHLAPPSGH